MIHRLFIIGLLITGLSAVPGRTAAQDAVEATATPSGSYVIPPDIYVRGGPGEAYAPVGRLIAGDTLIPLGRSEAGDWVLIDYRRGFGWIRRDLGFWIQDIDALPAVLEDNLTLTVPTRVPYLFTPTPEGNWVDTTDPGGVSVRVGPDLTFSRIGLLLAGERVEPVARDVNTTWILIRFGDGFGWIARNLVRWRDDVNMLPIISRSNLTPTATYTDTPTPTPTPTPTDTPTPTATFTPSDTPTLTLTPTLTPTITPTLTETPTETPTLTPTFTETPSETPTLTPTFTETPSKTPTPTPTFTETPSKTPTLTPTFTETPSETPTLTPTFTETPSETPTPTLTETLTLTPTATDTVVAPSMTPVPTEVIVAPSETPVPTATLTSTSTPSETPTPTVTPTSTETPTLTETSEPSATPTVPSETPVQAVILVLTDTSTPEPTLTATPTSTDTPTITPSVTPQPTETPTPEPSATPVPPTETPTITPSATPVPPTATLSPSAAPTQPTAAPSETPVAAVASVPTAAPPVMATTGGAPTLPLELLFGGLGVLAVLVYAGLYLRGLASLERYEGGFAITRCPVCKRGQLTLDMHQARLLGIPRARRTVRCSACRSVLRESGKRRWRYAIDRSENPAMYQLYNGREIDEDTLVALDIQPVTPSEPPRSRPPAKPPTFIDEDET